MKLEQATSKNTKVGDKCYIEVEIENISNEISPDYPILCDLGTFSKDGYGVIHNKKNPLYHIRQEEIPTLGDGVEMEVSDNEVVWEVRKIIAINPRGKYMTSNYFEWNYARPIQPTLEQKYENILKENEELKKQLNK